MPKSVHTDAYATLLVGLVAARKRVGVTQEALAAALDKPQNFISNVERGQRRIDVLEFYAIARALDVDPTALFKSVTRGLPKRVEI